MTQHIWYHRVPSFLNDGRVNFEYWRCERCGLYLEISEVLNESMPEFLERSGFSWDCDFSIVSSVLLT